VEVADNGRAAVELVGQEDFDVVLMDVRMPVMDGLEATAAIRNLDNAEKARVPIIALTAHALESDEQRCLAAGMNAYMSKPINNQKLTELVEQLVAGSESPR
jgi:CheY-like chemotaxis protein